MQIRVLLVDDEKPSRQELRYLLEKRQEIQIVGEAASGEEALERLKDLKPDVVFLDIEMPDMNGFDVVIEMFDMGIKPIIVFATAYDEYAIKAFEINAVDYILKPFSEERLAKTVDRLVDILRKPQNEGKEPDRLINLVKILQREKVFEKVPGWKKDRICPLNPEEIVYAFADGKNVVIRTTKGEYTTNHTLQELEDKLAYYGFFRCHKSFLINMNHVKEAIPWFNYTYIVIMNSYGDEEIPVSRTKVKEFKRLLGI